MDYKGKLVFITGASAGIGREFAKQFYGLGASLYLVARREELLSELAKELDPSNSGRVIFKAVDLCNENSLNELIEDIKLLDIYTLVNNAGHGSFGYFETLDLDTELSQINLNIVATVKLAHAVIPKMKEKKQGEIISLSSIAGFQPLPLMSTYAATKAFNLFHSLGLREELREFGVDVLTVCPGPVATEFGGVARVPGTMTGGTRDSAESVVRSSLKTLKREKAFVVPCLRAKLMSLPSRLLSKSFTSRRVYKVLSKVYAKANR